MTRGIFEKTDLTDGADGAIIAMLKKKRPLLTRAAMQPGSKMQAHAAYAVGFQSGWILSNPLSFVCGNIKSYQSIRRCVGINMDMMINEEIRDKEIPPDWSGRRAARHHADQAGAGNGGGEGA